jgi:Myb-like DNA-binding domain
MTAFIEPLPGLLDDPLLHLPDLPPRTDVRIPPLRDPFPSRTFSAPSPLEPNAPGDKQIQGGVKLGSSKSASKAQRTTPKITPADVISARDTKKSNLAISALVDSSSTNQLPRLLPPSFVNLAAVENNPTFQSWLPEYPPLKRLKIDQEYHGEYVQLPKPRQKEMAKRVPLLPTIVNGIHEPPPSAALLPPMELEEVKAMLASISEPSGLPPEKMLNSPEIDAQVPRGQDQLKPPSSAQEVATEVISKSSAVKPPRTWKKWSDDETRQLLNGVAKHGHGRWKEICNDPELRFRNRKPMDLKDRFRICVSTATKKDDGLPVAQFHDTSSPSRVHPPDVSSIHGPSSSTRTTSSTWSKISQANFHPPQHPTYPTIISPAPKQTPTDLPHALKSRTLHHRVRKLWTESEHQNLVRGFAKHGYQWTTIRNDSELNLSHRKATDIRDKFRSLFPQQYMDAESGPPLARKSTANVGVHGPARRDSLPQILGGRLVTSTTINDQRHPIPSQSHAAQGVKLPPRPEEFSSSKEAGTETLEPQEGSTAPNLTTLPPLTLGDNDWDWDDNKLAPLLDWEEFGL